MSPKFSPFFCWSAGCSNVSSIWGIGWLSFFWAASSLMVVSLLPSFITGELKASKVSLGIIEGVSISSTFLIEVFSGISSDYFRARKPFMMVGSVLNIIIKPLFAFSYSTTWVFSIRLLDRLSKGIRSAPTVALIADLAPKNLQGSSYGLRQALYVMGAMVGSLSATILMKISNNNFRLVFLFATLPAIFALIILWKIVRPAPYNNKTKFSGWRIKDIKKFPLTYWKLLFVVSILMLARFSEAFICLHAQDVGWQVFMLPMVFFVMEFVHAFIAYPIGKLADHSNRHVLFFNGLLSLFLANIIFIYFSSPMGALIGVFLTGLHMGMTQGLIATLIAASTPVELRGTAFGFYYLVSGIAILLGNFIAGSLAHIYGIYSVFVGANLFIALAAFLFFLFMLKQN